MREANRKAREGSLFLWALIHTNPKEWTGGKGLGKLRKNNSRDRKILKEPHILGAEVQAQSSRVARSELGQVLGP